MHRVLARLGISLAVRGPWSRLRGAALAVGSALLTLGLGGLVLAASYSGLRQERADAIRPTYASVGQQAQLLQSFDGFTSVNDRPVTVISIWPLSANAPLPPGVIHWPGAGEAVLSPALLDDMRTTPDKFGRVAGVIQPGGLEVPRERRVYLRPTRAAFSHVAMKGVVGYGAGLSNGSGYGAGVLNAAPNWEVNGLLLATLILPALGCLGVATSLDGEARDRRTKLLTALGASRRHRAVVDACEAAPAITIGTVIGAVVLTIMCMVNISISALDAELAAEGARRSIDGLAGATVFSAVLALLVVLAVRARPRLGRRRAVLTAEQQPERLRSTVFLLAVIATVWFTAQSHQAVFRTLAYLAGAAVVTVTLPAVVGLILATMGEVVGAVGLQRGSAGALLGGRRLQRFPHRTARLALGVSFGILMLGQVQLWASQLGAQYHDALTVRTQMGNTVVAADHTTYGSSMSTFLAALPATAKPIWVAIEPPSESDPKARTITHITAPCASLHVLGLSCEPRSPLPATPAPNLAQLLQFGPVAGDIRVDPAGRPDLARLKKAEATLILVSPTVNGIPLDQLQRAAYRILPGGLQLSTLGQDWVTAGNNLAIRAKWTVLLGTLGVLAVAIAGACALAGDVIASGQQLTKIALLTGRRRWVYVLTMWRSTAPLLLAGLLGAAVYLILPTGLSSGSVYMRPSAPLALGVLAGAATIGTLTAVWAARRLTR